MKQFGKTSADHGGGKRRTGIFSRHELNNCCGITPIAAALVTTIQSSKWMGPRMSLGPVNLKS